MTTLRAERPLAQHRTARPGRGATVALVCAGVAATGWFAVRQAPALAELRVPEITSWWWVAVAVVACAASFEAAGGALRSLTPVPISRTTAYTAQVGAAATRLVAPGSAGVVGVNARLLTRRGTPLPVALATVGATQVAQLVLTLAGLLVAVPFVGGRLDVTPPAVDPWWAAAGASAMVLGAVLALRSTRGREALQTVRTAAQPLGDVLRRPAAVVVLALRCLGLTACLSLCLWACVQALGGSAHPVTIGVAMLVGTTLGSVVPTPGGVGGVEGAMVACLVATGTAAAVAVPAVLLFRLVSFWLPVPAGLAALAWLRRTGRI